MTFHIVLPRKMNDDEARAIDRSAERPRVGVMMLAHRLSAEVHFPTGDAAAPGLDRWRTLLAGPPSMWALARRLADRVQPGDVIFCSSEAGGLHIAEACGNKQVKIVIFVHNLDRPRGRVALKLFRVRRAALLLACSAHQTAFLREYLGLSDASAQFIWDHTDTAFFAPGPATSPKTRPLIVSVGLEQRDYQTLAAATHDMNVDVRISGFSEDAAVLAQTFPAVMPANMHRKFYSWPDLAQLYRDADLVVVSARENKYAAGVQSLMEAMACRRPIVATRTQGLSSYLDDDAVLAVPPGDVAAMRQAITCSLENPEAAARRAEAGHQLALKRHRIERYVDDIETHLRTL